MDVCGLGSGIPYDEFGMGMVIIKQHKKKDKVRLEKLLDYVFGLISGLALLLIFIYLPWPNNILFWLTAPFYPGIWIILLITISCFYFKQKHFAFGLIT